MREGTVSKFSMMALAARLTYSSGTTTAIRKKVILRSVIYEALAVAGIELEPNSILESVQIECFGME